MLMLLSILFVRSKIFKAKSMDGLGENYKLLLFSSVRLLSLKSNWGRSVVSQYSLR